MIKNYELVLIGLLISCSLSNAMDNEEKSPIDIMFESFISYFEQTHHTKLNQKQKDSLWHVFKEEMLEQLSEKNISFHNNILNKLNHLGINPIKENIAKEKNNMRTQILESTATYKVPAYTKKQIISNMNKIHKTHPEIKCMKIRNKDETITTINFDEDETVKL